MPFFRQIMSNPEAVFAPMRTRLNALAVRHRLEPVALPEEFSRVEGSWGRSPLELVTTVHRGPGPLSRVQHAEVKSADGAMAALTVVTLADPEQDVPVFGVDLVAFRGRFVLAALDLSGGSVEPDAELRGARSRLLAAARPRELPDFARSCFSDLAVVVSEDENSLDGVLPQVFSAYADTFERALDGPKRRPRAAGQAEQAEYFAAMQANKRESKALGRLFGEEWADRFFSELFFAP